MVLALTLLARSAWLSHSVPRGRRPPLAWLDRGVTAVARTQVARRGVCPASSASRSTVCDHYRHRPPQELAHRCRARSERRFARRAARAGRQLDIGDAERMGRALAATTLGD